jgi:adenylyltransferase/sulfurtransferase
MTQVSAELAEARVLLVGAGGLGCPIGTILARSGIGHITLLDDDTVEPSNLPRQTLFEAADVDQLKAALASARLEAEAARCGNRLTCVARESRLLPQNAVEIVSDFDLVVEGADNFATKFLAADACAIANVPLVQAGVVRWVGWALACVPGGSACLRCVFEDVPRERAETCAEAGVVGPVVGVVAALAASLALRVLNGDSEAAGTLYSYRALSADLRGHRAPRATDCPLCAGRFTTTPLERYAPPACDTRPAAPAP